MPVDEKFGPLAEKAFHAYQGFVDSFSDNKPAPRIVIFGTEVHGGVIYYPVFFVVLALLLMSPWLAHQIVVKPMLAKEARKEKQEAGKQKKAE
mmetsp:Transcript_29154/g.67100  ORF Transcript_29154/g.67100 Transcript_29154/m.67100 type:complete len:93 (+) Transcript_29154:94-372(+)